MQWSDFRVRTSAKVPKGTIVMHPDDASAMRSPRALVETLVDNTRRRRLCKPRNESDDEARERIRAQVEAELRRRGDMR